MQDFKNIDKRWQETQTNRYLEIGWTLQCSKHKQKKSLVRNIVEILDWYLKQSFDAKMKAGCIKNLPVSVTINLRHLLLVKHRRVFSMFSTLGCLACFFPFGSLLFVASFRILLHRVTRILWRKPFSPRLCWF